MELLPYEGEATHQETRAYQRITGLILYAAIITRPNVTFLILRLARFNTNLSKKYYIATPRVVSYLLDIYNHQLREKIAREEISVNYVPTKEQVVNGFTKALRDVNFRRFKEQISVVNISKHLKGRKLKILEEEDLEALEDLLEGGEAKGQAENQIGRLEDVAFFS